LNKAKQVLMVFLIHNHGASDDDTGA